MDIEITGVKKIKNIIILIKTKISKIKTIKLNNDCLKVQ